ncbi:tryptophan-rich sensory protein [Sporosarcina sp. HYO08]|uniref:tryptophan-rich sensory protein n=1 Tax=Sporosarcina sp. HYO08 TaxID=1759557 RepID=UPI000798B2DB|nr:tryptophan-rich sensory protein [Sporosarcina sp. HYO08]KXH78817.1 hypothetical protein AU377_12515 [Sporosarcina sp. HYO08]
MLRFLFMVFSLVAVITVNAAANLIPFNGKTTWEIASRLPALFMPAGYVFLIWGMIYALLFIWVYRFKRENMQIEHGMKAYRSFLFISACLLSILWILFWHYGLFGWTIVATVILILTLLALHFTYPKKSSALYGRLPISVFLGWSFLLLLANINYVLTLHEWSGFGLSNPLWTVIYLTIATAFALHFMYHHHDVPLNIVFIWTFVGIAVKNGTEELFVSVAALFLATVISACIFLFRKT